MFKKIFKIENVYAHCDVPCGLYDPQQALMAANTVRVMIKQLKDIENDPEYKNNKEDLKFKNYIVRRITTKENHAELCKREVLILWTDYFKEDDLKIVPDLHEQIWKTVKLASYNKQNVDSEKAEELYKQVEVIKDIFDKVVEARKK